MRRRQLEGLFVTRPCPCVVTLDGSHHAKAVGHPSFGRHVLGKLGSGEKMGLRPGGVSLAKARPAGAEQRVGLGSRRRRPLDRFGKKLAGEGEVTRLQRQIGEPEPGLRRAREMTGELRIQPLRGLGLAGIGRRRRQRQTAVQLLLLRRPELALALFFHRQPATGTETQDEPRCHCHQACNPGEPLDFRYNSPHPSRSL